MDKQLNLKDVQKEISVITYALKAGPNCSGDFLGKSEKAKKRLLEIRKGLQGNLRTGHHNLNVLQKDSSGQLQKAKQIATNEINKIKELINEIGSALDYYHHRAKKAISPAKTTQTSRYMAAERNIDLMSTSEVTSQTIALLDAERYGTTTGHGVFIEYPRPDLGSPTNQRDCDITEKIRIGLGNSAGDRRGNYQITMPKFYQEFGREKV